MPRGYWRSVLAGTCTGKGLSLCYPRTTAHASTLIFWHSGQAAWGCGHGEWHLSDGGGVRGGGPNYRHGCRGQRLWQCRGQPCRLGDGQFLYPWQHISRGLGDLWIGRCDRELGDITSPLGLGGRGSGLLGDIWGGSCRLSRGTRLTRYRQRDLKNGIIVNNSFGN